MDARSFVKAALRGFRPSEVSPKFSIRTVKQRYGGRRGNFFVWNASSHLMTLITAKVIVHFRLSINRRGRIEGGVSWYRWTWLLWNHCPGHFTIFSVTANIHAHIWWTSLLKWRCNGGCPQTVAYARSAIRCNNSTGVFKRFHKVACFPYATNMFQTKPLCMDINEIMGESYMLNY